MKYGLQRVRGGWGGGGMLYNISNMSRWVNAMGGGGDGMCGVKGEKYLF